MKRSFILIFLNLFLFSLHAGGAVESSDPATAPSHAAGYPRTVIDARGEQITLEAEPTRIVSLGPNITELIFALGRGGSLVGRTDWCSYPSETAEVASVGSLREPSIEAILSLHPDLVIASTHAPMDVLDLLGEAGVNTAIYYGPDTYEGLYQVVHGTGEILGAEEEARGLTEDIRRRTDKVLSAVAALKSRPRVYFVVAFGEGGDWTATGDTFIHQMLTMAGGDNIASDSEGWSYSLEKLMVEDPDMIIINNGLGESFRNSPLYSELRAVREGRVFEVDENIIVRQGPRLIEGLETLSALFGA